ncbi:MAG: sugar transferase [Beijerinckiaceae bacterium]|nr:sugar transferase [Beijerinckiaceae bacterium]MDO9442037.1 sugar transferase [Beijerinckiaceae bacterium]
MTIHNTTDYDTLLGQDSQRAIGGSAKRAFDLVASVAAAIVVAPLLIMLSLLILVTNGGPVTIRHQRVGKGGRKFGCFKFRTMVTNGDEVLKRHLAENPAAMEEWTRNRKLVVDPRVTRLGRILRKTSLDELPQLFNIIAGDMSFVGPRPIVEDEIVRYGNAFAEYSRARPGLTGRWQISGRNDTGYDERVKLDREYVTNWSFSRDIVILVLTIPAVIKARGVY